MSDNADMAEGQEDPVGLSDVDRLVLSSVPTFEALAMPLPFDKTTFEGLCRAYDRVRAKTAAVPKEFKVTQEQLDELRALVPTAEPTASVNWLLGIPVRLVDTFEESTVYERWLIDVAESLRKVPNAWQPTAPDHLEDV